jgi:hypothetical protein
LNEQLAFILGIFMGLFGEIKLDFGRINESLGKKKNKNGKLEKHFDIKKWERMNQFDSIHLSN